MIHTIAYNYESSIIKIPKPYSVEQDGYIMERMYDLSECIHPFTYCKNPVLFAELIDFTRYMFLHGYLAYEFHIFRSRGYYVLLDFSMFAWVQGRTAKLPKRKEIYTLGDIDLLLQISICGCDCTCDSAPPPTPIQLNIAPIDGSISTLTDDSSIYSIDMEKFLLNDLYT